jgi:hypothetical protein
LFDRSRRHRATAKSRHCSALGAVVQELGGTLDDGAELVVAECPDQNAAGVVMATFAPLPQ